VNDHLIHLRSHHLSEKSGGITAICSTHRTVLETALRQAAADGDVLLVEVTSNQVNQFGGYTGMRPSQFAAYVRALAEAAGFPLARLIIGADHIGPHPWRHMPAARAMQEAATLVEACVKAGFEKIHLDPATGCADDPVAILPVELAAERSAVLCRAAETEARREPQNRPPLYVIGAEVPLPGGSFDGTDPVEVTAVASLARVLEEFKTAFRRNLLMEAWTRVLAVVVQPGVDFGNTQIARYQPGRAAELSAYHATLPGMMTYEVHSADYQMPAAIRRMIRDHFAILKVGPSLTNAYREAVFSLSCIETEWLANKKQSRLSKIRDTLDSVMRANPEHWQAYYRGNAAEARFMRRYSYRDRVRYYWNCPEVAVSVNRLLANLNRPLPGVLVRQYFPDLYPAVESGEIAPLPSSLIQGRIRRTLIPYIKACRPRK
jgi:D-tagatose-1,6-bisphosphate aldolase subunit GatZ/KbaZ